MNKHDPFPFSNFTLDYQRFDTGHKLNLCTQILSWTVFCIGTGAEIIVKPAAGKLIFSGIRRSMQQYFPFVIHYDRTRCDRYLAFCAVKIQAVLFIQN